MDETEKADLKWALAHGLSDHGITREQRIKAETDRKRLVEEEQRENGRRAAPEREDKLRGILITQTVGAPQSTGNAFCRLRRLCRSPAPSAGRIYRKS